MTNTRDAVRELATKARGAARVLRSASTTEKNAALEAIAVLLEERSKEITEANGQDIARGIEVGLTDALIDRLTLDESRIAGIADAVRQLIALPDPVGEVVAGRTLPNGLTVRNVRVPMGVVGMIYEARPNVTVDAACLALKAGSAVLLRGGSAAEQTNVVLVALMREAIDSVGIPSDAIASVDEWGREGATELMAARGYIDLLIPRGGAGLIQSVVANSTVPVIETGVGNCHVFINADADRDRAVAIAVNAKTHRPGVCNAAETLLLHEGFEHGGAVLAALADRGVTLHVDEAARSLAEQAGVSLELIKDATAEDWDTEYLSLDMAVAVVSSVDEAIAHIDRHSSGHTEAIVTDSVADANRFVAAIDSAAVMVNASTRFTDGGELGLGAEIGISTQKLHARGPMGLAELTTTTCVVEGSGHVR
ncbi:glutamate-5-semialdehyde dehydrogenase [Flaviflexus salsibiostraticola]|uniref:Gamma-glutamyl phosphate reductase n=1 Tax=Flaviflexus salsibiostraticola TaxID=1282737 RepID=A0A3Q8WSY0_9ACTO|nr:glutamate-5-semialdehyde dehydrogenase [Flaviflexus salsibiostraticola]AZN29557.1 glutamate-5-semialdehyde dehydrogenase [Flaviflexus salsibiostraticola]